MVPTVPDHELLRLLGRGSYGEVWLARSTLGAWRAVKVVHRAWFDSDRPYEREFCGIQRFEPVSRSHEGLVDILHVGRSDKEESFYYVMELADDADTEKLKEVNGTVGASPAPPSSPFSAERYTPRTFGSAIAERARLPISDILSATLTLASALAHLHKHGLLHRDIKPANIVFVGGVAKLADIGLVAGVGEAATWVGTEGFIPPEGPGTKQADVYALGKVLYEASTGRDRLEYPSLPVQREGGAANQELLELNAIVLKACARDPARRYRSAEEMYADLALLQSGRSVKRHHALEANLAQAQRIGLAAALVALVAIGAMWFKSREAGVERKHRQEIEAALLEANVARARAERNSGLAGARQASLDAITRAVMLRGATAEARTEAITALAMTDFHEVRRWPALARLLPEMLAPQALSHDGQWLAQTDEHGAIRLSSVGEAGSAPVVLRVLPGDGRPAQAVGPFSSNGSKLLSIAGDGSEKVWEVSNGVLLLNLAPPPRGRPRFFTQNGSHLVVLESDGSVKLHGLTGNGSRSLNFGMPLEWFALSPDSHWLATADSTTNRIRVFAFPDATPAAELVLPGGVFGTCTGFSQDSVRLAAGCSDHGIRIWTWRVSGTPPVELRGHATMPTSAVFSPSHDLLASTAWDGTTRLWDAIHGTLLSTLPNTSTELAFTADGRYLVRLATPPKMLIQSALAGGEVCRVLHEVGTPTPSNPQHASFSTDGLVLVTAGTGGARLWDVATGRELALLPGEDAVRAVFDGAGRSVWVSGRHEVRRWPLADGVDGKWQIGPPRIQPLDHVWNMMAARDGHSIFLAPLDQRRLVLQSGDSLGMKLTNSQLLWHAALSADGRWLAGTRRGSSVQVWNTDSGNLSQTFSDPEVLAGVLSPDGRWLYMSSLDAISQREVSTRRLGWRFASPGPLGSGRAIACAPSGEMLAVLLNERQVALLDTASGELLARIEHPDRRQVATLAFSPDGGHLALACPSGVVQLWNLRRLRAELTALKLDWHHPQLPPAASTNRRPLTVTVERGE